MRLMRRSAAGRALTASVIASAALALVVVASPSGPARAATSVRRGAAAAVATPSTVTAGTTITIQVTCGSPQATSATLSGTTLGLPTQTLMNSQPSGGGVFTLTVTLPGSIQPGTFRPAIECSDGSSAAARLRVVTATPSSAGAQASDGTTSTATNAGLSAAGLALIAVGAVAGGIALRRRSGTRSRP